MNVEIHHREKQIAKLIGAFVAALCFGLGSWWLVTQLNIMEQVQIRDAGLQLRGRMNTFRQMVGVDSASLEFANFKILMNRFSGAELELPEGFDVVAMYNADRKFMTGARRLVKENRVVSLPAEAVSAWIPGDTTLFDQAADGASVSGLLVIDGRPLAMTLRRITGQPSGFVFLGRWLDPRRLVANAVMAQEVIDVYVPNDQGGLPPDVEAARSEMKGDRQEVYRLMARGRGVGYLRFEDVNERTAFVVRYSWSSESSAVQSRALMWLGGGSIFVGLVVYGAAIIMLMQLERRRRRMRGFNGMTEHDVRELVESFPGFALAVNRRLEYVGVSRILSGLIGREPSEFAGKKFGSVCHEGKADMETLLIELGNQERWPRMSDIVLEIAGLNHVISLTGVAHYVRGPEVVLAILNEKKLDQVGKESKNASDSQGEEAA